MKTIIARICFILVLAVSAGATNYTVKAAGGGNYTTIAACAAVAVAGDTCTVYAGSYAGWTQTASGTSGNPITFTVNPGDTVTITSSVTVTNTSYVTIGAPDSGGGCAASGRTTGAGGANPSFMVGGCFVFQNAGIQGPVCGSGNHTYYFHLTYNTSRGNNPPQFVSFGQGAVNGSTQCGLPYVDTTSNNNYFAHNDVNWNIDSPTAPFCTSQFLTFGNKNLYEYNDMQGMGLTHIRLGGSYNVIRLNYGHDNNGNITLGCGQSPEHMDFVFGEGGDEPSISFSLVEKNVWERCSNDAGNCKFIFSRADANDAYSTSDSVISRYNYMYSLDGSYAGAGDQSDGTNTTPNWHTYNNTVATESLNTSSGACGTFDSGIATVLNQLCYNSQGTNGYTPIYFYTSGSFSNGDQAYDTGCPSCTWSGGSSAYINEATYSRLANQNPMWANYPTDGTVQSGSRVLASSTNGGGVSLTTVSSGCGTNSLVVGDARFFQAGYGATNIPDPVPGDRISVGTSATAQITAVNYTTNTLTLASSVSCTNGASVNLNTDTLGNVVVPLGQANPDVGAFPSTSSSTPPPSPPAGLTAVVN